MLPVLESNTPKRPFLWHSKPEAFVGKYFGSSSDFPEQVLSSQELVGPKKKNSEDVRSKKTSPPILSPRSW